MKKLLTFIAIFMALALFVVAPANAAMRHYVAQVYAQTTERPDQLTLITSGITYQVLAVGTDTEETLYSDEALTAMTNVVTTTVFDAADRIDFYSDPTDSSNDLAVDLIVTNTAGGYSVFVEDFDPYTRSIVIDQRPNVMHHGVIFFQDTDALATDTEVDFLKDTMISLVCVEVITVASGKLIGIETVDTVDGFILDQSLTSAGYFCNNKPAITAGGSETYVSTASNIGSLMGSSLAGGNTGTDEGSHYQWSHVVVTAGVDDDLYFDTDDNAGFEANGYIHYFFMRLR